MTEDTHAVLVRPLTTGRWEICEYADSEESAIAKAASSRDGLSHGDLILAIDIAEISAIQERCRRLYFVNGENSTTKAPVQSSAWLSLWEGPKVYADLMLLLCHNVDQKLLTAAACKIARTVLCDDDKLSTVAIEAAEDWAHHGGSIEAVELASRDVYSIVLGDNPVADRYAASSAFFAACVATESSSRIASKKASTSAMRAAKAMPGDHNENLRQLAHVVRQYIPLHVVLESLT